MIAPRIRPIALCVFRHTDRILVVEGYDSVKGQTFYRPIGGGIEFGEAGRDAVVREIREEIAQEVDGVEYLGTLENIFTYKGAPGHEIVAIYDACFVDESLYAAVSIPGFESDGKPMHIVWRRLDSFSEATPLYPAGLLDLLQASR